MESFGFSFDRYACDGDTSEATALGGVRLVAEIVHDSHAALDDDDSHNPDQSVTGCDDKQQAALLEARKAYERGEWWYGGVRLTATHPLAGTRHESLWGIEVNYPDSDNEHLAGVADELAWEALVSFGWIQGP